MRGWHWGPCETQPAAAAGVAHDVKELESLVQSDDHPWQAVLICPAMGDLKASGVAQVFSQGLLRHCGALPSRCWMTFGMPPPSGDLWRGVYIDDILNMTICSKRRLEQGCIAQARRRLLLRTESAHAWAGSELAAQKSRCKEASATVWCATLDGERGEVSGEQSSPQQLWS